MAPTKTVLVTLFAALTLAACGGAGLAIKDSRLGGAPGGVAAPDSDDYYLRLEFNVPSGTHQVKFSLSDQKGALVREWVKDRKEGDLQVAELKLDGPQAQPLEKGIYKLHIVALDDDGEAVGKPIGQVVNIQ
jgi:hypothetical protein